MSIGKYRYHEDNWREAVQIVSDLLVLPRQDVLATGRALCSWERKALRFLSRMLANDDHGLSMNAWVYEWVREYEKTAMPE